MIVWQLFEELRDKLAAKYQELQQKKQVSRWCPCRNRVDLELTQILIVNSSKCQGLQLKKQVGIACRNARHHLQVA